MSDGVIYYDPTFLDHLTGPEHPECPARLERVVELLNAARPELFRRLEVPPIATQDDLCRAHALEHIQHLQHLANSGGGTIEPDTVVSHWSELAARKASGAAVAACQRVLSGELGWAFCLARPPGHHATRREAMGFCLYNHAAVAALAAVARGAERVAVVDIDAHHGNGTQDILYREPNAYYLSIHLEPPSFPNTGLASERGAGPGEGRTLNVPIHESASPTNYFHALDRVLAELRLYRPDLMILSSGFDIHWQDPVGGLNLQREDIRVVAARLEAVAHEVAGGRLVSILEGGYNLETLPQLVIDHLDVLAT